MSEPVAQNFRLYWQKKRWETENILNVPFLITPEYLQEIWTGYCPIYKHPLPLPAIKGTPRCEAPQLDRLDPSLGYVEGNVTWLSPRANRLKSDASAVELMRLGLWLLEQKSAQPTNRAD